MKAVWPDEAGFAGVFGEGDPCPGEVISDRYGLVSYSADLAIATNPRLPSLDRAGLGFLKRADPAEYRRVEGLARRRAAARRRGQKLVPGSADWLVLDVHYLALAQEKEILAQLGLTLDEALALVR